MRPVALYLFIAYCHEKLGRLKRMFESCKPKPPDKPDPPETKPRPTICDVDEL